ncbi:hypothetical protein CUZ56_01182 [Saezia sanguinis]|uniref:Lipopolysaccharide core heptosyltransferase RfaQ n=1 Tax=Saezia sanguinis TaxID=1965230 RepID=A0A433SET7_9BURK|nr:glycosyltransferase family 9 protein [Saezia sanguinis]RUS67240.1 hypothetical protein CUZ56_01182 [Saezia sanguinis]
MIDYFYSVFYNILYARKLKKFQRQIDVTYQALVQQLHRSRQSSIDLLKVKSILVIKNEAIGDMVLTTPLIRHLALHGYQVDVLATGGNQAIVRHNPYIRRLHVQQVRNQDIKPFIQETFHDLHYDMVLDVRYPSFNENIDWLIFPQDIPCNYLVSWNRSHLGCYDVSLNFYDVHAHFIRVMDLFLSYLGIPNADLSCDLFVDEATNEKGQAYVEKLRQSGEPVIVFNPFASHETRDLSRAQIQDIIKGILQRYPQAQVVLIGYEDRLAQIEVPAAYAAQVHRFSSPSIMDVVPLVRCADLVITPDTSIVHIAATFEKPTVGLYIHALRPPRNGKEKAKRHYYQQMQLLKDYFFDAPHIDAGQRPRQILINDDLMSPNNPQAVQLFSATATLADLSVVQILNTVNTLIQQHVQQTEVKGRC